MPSDEEIQTRKDTLARKRAMLDQMEKIFEDQYPFKYPRVNLWRLDDLRVREFELEIDRWELEELTKEGEDA